ncbi:hypothetical protein [Ornithinibacillus sp. JPR2-1]|uniref:hypothetical protein n=1 Tax=Ornithinibacillus sp. JPR2-1 TaxID=2094019 RepID=UPI0031D76E94
MKNSIFIFYQSLLWGVLLVTNIVLNPYIGPPFEWIDVVSMMMLFLSFFIVFLLLTKVFIRHVRSVRYKIGLSILAFIIAVLFLVVLENVWFEVTGKMLF